MKTKRRVENEGKVPRPISALILKTSLDQYKWLLQLLSLNLPGSVSSMRPSRCFAKAIR